MKIYISLSGGDTYSEQQLHNFSLDSPISYLKNMGYSGKLRQILLKDSSICFYLEKKLSHLIKDEYVLIDMDLLI